MRHFYTGLCSLFVLLCVFHTSPTKAGAWTQPEGEGFFITNAVYYTNDEFYNLDGQKQDQQRFDKYEINPYIEYGLRENLTIGANLFLDYVTQDDGRGTAQNNVGFADTELFARTTLYADDKYRLTLQPLLKLPSLFREGTLPNSGDEEFATELSVFGGYSFQHNKRYHFAEARVGYRKRFGSLEDQYLLESRIGYRVTDELTLIPAAYATLSADLPESGQFQQTGDIDYDLYKLELGSMYQWDKRYSLHASGFYHVDGRNTGGGYGVSLGLGQRF